VHGGDGDGGLVQSEQVAGRGVGVGAAVGVGVGVGGAVGVVVGAGVGVGTDMGVGAVCGAGVGNNPDAEDEGDVDEPDPGGSVGDVPGWDEPAELPPGATPAKPGRLPSDDVPVP
jgi:hypothetical protein